MNNKMSVSLLVVLFMCVAILVLLNFRPELDTSKYNEKMKVDVIKANIINDKLSSVDRDHLSLGGEGFPGIEDADFENDWSGVDLIAVRDKLPNNLYWELAAPTQDQLLLEQREDIKKYWNQMYGKVLAGIAVEQEVHEYYKRKRQVSQDYIDFADFMLKNYSNVLLERDKGLLNLSRNLHKGVLKDIPAQLSVAVKRSFNHEAKREEWLNDKESYIVKLRKEAEQKSSSLSQ